MKRLLRISVVFLCVAVFASLLFIAVKQSSAASVMPKGPIYATYASRARSVVPTSICVELPENHNAEGVVLYFGDELGRFDDLIGMYEVTDNTVICDLPMDVEFPEKATKIWIYALNEKGMSDTGCQVDLSNQAAPTTLDEESEEKEVKVEHYALITIGSALIVSLLAYAWLGKKPAEDEEKSEEEKA